MPHGRSSNPHTETNTQSVKLSSTPNISTKIQSQVNSVYMAPVNILHSLATVRQEALRNAAVLDQISIPCRNQNRRRASSNRKSIEIEGPASSHPDEPSTTSPEQPDSQHQNDKDYNTNDYSSDPASSEEEAPISKRILTAIFSVLDKNVDENRQENYISIENDLEDHFLIGLVLPLIARLLVVSHPGLLCIVQLPGHDVPPQWARNNSYDGYGSNGSNGSNGSKSGAPTTPSPQDTSRTPSPSDDGVEAGDRKSISPDTDPAEFVRDASQALYGEAQESKKRSGSSEGSPSPENSVHIHRALRLMCNGFEVLTGKMPPPKQSMGVVTLATVGWDKAGIVRPEDSSKGIAMSFSNGMTVSTEGIVVTFTNGSLCLLTLRDPIAGLEHMKVSSTTPVVVFSFSSRGQLSIGNLRTMTDIDSNSATARAKEQCARPNFFFAEVGPRSQDMAGEGISEPLASSSDLENRESLQNVLATQASTPSKPQKEKDQMPNESQSQGEEKNSDEKKSVKTEQALPLTVIPRAVPLFINTIHRVFLDPPDMDWDDDLYDYDQNREGCDVYCDCNECNQDVAQPATQDHKPSGQSRGQVPRTEAQEGAPKVESTYKGTNNIPTSTPSPEHQSYDKKQYAVATSAAVNTGTNQAHNPYYNYYGYSSHPGYQHAPQNYMVQTPPVSNLLHHSQPAIGNAQNGYYVGGPPPPVPNGHPQYHSGETYPHHSYYSVPAPSTVMHSNSVGSGQWHHGVPTVHHPQPPIPTRLDGRGDMSVPYRSHNPHPPSMTPQYPTPYYMTPQHANNRPGSHGSLDNPRYENDPKAPASGNSRRGSFPMSEARPDPSSLEKHRLFVSRTLATERWASNNANRMSPDVVSLPNGRSSVPQSGKDTTKVTEKDDDKAKALEALMDMEEYGRRHDEERKSVDPGTQSMQARNVENNGAEKYNHGKSMKLKRKQHDGVLAERQKREPNGKLDRPEITNELSRKSQRKETDSSTSTNSQGATLKGAMTGHSPNPAPTAYPDSQPWQKRPRQK